MTFLVRVGLEGGFSVPAQYLRLDDPVSGLLDVGLLAPDGLVSDLATDAAGINRVMAFSIDRGSSQNTGALVEYAAATLSLTLRDNAGDLDPVTLGQPMPGVSIQLSKVLAGMVYPLFTGTIDSWLPEHRYPDQAVVEITATDALGTLGRYERGEQELTVGADETTGARIDRLLNEAGWPLGMRDIDTGVATLAATTLSGNILTQMRETAFAEVGDLWATPAGVIRFRDRYGLHTGATSSVSQGTFGGDVAGGELPWVGQLGISYDRDSVINLIRAARDEEDAEIFQSSDEESRARYGDQGPGVQSLPLNTDVQVAAWTDYVRAREGHPKLRFTNVDIDVRVNEALLWPQVLQRDFGDRVTIVRRPPGGIVDSRETYIRAIRHAFTAPNRWVTSWELEGAPVGSPFILDDAVRGLLDNNILIY